ncbi:hypothetical protein HAX54_012485 [Datura stramonium]|uniref:Uncharacterized protein n=1 Tax=Datura stramonium TaxID=4076 RepID=A0ABS8TMN8_DATST|nr:hypothetical protein [Datura stramonium]
MDPVLGKKTCYVQFPQRFDGIDLHDRYANRNIVFFDVSFTYTFPGLLISPSDQLERVGWSSEGPVYVELGAVLTGRLYMDKKRAAKRTESTIPIFNMEDIEEGVEAFFGFVGYDDEKSLLMSQRAWEFGQSPALPNMVWLQWQIDAWKIAYINTIVYPITSIPLIAYCMLPAICKSSDGGNLSFLSIDEYQPNDFPYGTCPIEEGWIATMLACGSFFSSFPFYATGILELRWSGVSIEDWWRNEQFWVIGGTSAHLFAVFQGLLKVLAGIDTNCRHIKGK